VVGLGAQGRLVGSDSTGIVALHEAGVAQVVACIGVFAAVVGALEGGSGLLVAASPIEGDAAPVGVGEALGGDAVVAGSKVLHGLLLAVLEQGRLQRQRRQRKGECQRGRDDRAFLSPVTSKDLRVVTLHRVWAKQPGIAIIEAHFERRRLSRK